jgi:hypothetical protein
MTMPTAHPTPARPVSDSLRFPIAVDPAAGRLAQEPDYPAHVEQLLRQLLLTNPGERVNRPDFGCGLRRMVFAPNTPEGASLLEVTISGAVNRWLASVVVLERVTARATGETLNVTLAYRLTTQPGRRVLTLAVTP